MTDDAALARLTAGEKLAARELVLRFLLAADAGDAAGAAATFTPDGVLLLDAGDAAVPPLELTGQQAIAEWGAAYLTRADGVRIRHVLSNFVVSPAQRGASVRLLIQNLDVATGPTLLSIGVGIGHAVRVGPDDWRLQRWEYRPDATRA